MSTMKKKNKDRPRVYLGQKEFNALSYLKKFSDFADKSDSFILKTCLMIVALDAKVKVEEVKKNVEEEAKKSSVSDTSGESDNNEVQGGDPSGENNQGVSGEAEAAKRGEAE